LKEKAIEEFKVYWVVAAFLALMFCAFITYRRLILTEFGVSYLHYGAGLVQALIVAKVILIGQALGVGSRIGRAPLIVAALVKAVIYGLLVAVFAAAEHWIEGVAHGKDLPTIWRGFIALGKDEILARMLVVIVAFIPFFALWMASEAVGGHRLLGLLLRRQDA
jgi:hypothetical protein